MIFEKKPVSYEIYENGKLVECDRNIALCNPFTYVYYSIRYWHFYKDWWRNLKSWVMELGEMLLAILLSVIFLPLYILNGVFPIISLLQAIPRINKARREVAKCIKRLKAQEARENAKTL